MRAVGGADLDELGTGAGHDVRHPEGAADLDQLAARNDRLAAERKCVEDQKNRRRVVVDDGRILGSGQFADERAQMIVTLAALALLDIEFEGNCLAHGDADSLDRLLGKKRPAEIGVQHRSGQVEDGAQGGAFPGLESAPMHRPLHRSLPARRRPQARPRAHWRALCERHPWWRAVRSAGSPRQRAASSAPDRPMEGCAGLAGEPVITSSIADQEWVERSAPIAAFAHKQVEAERRHVVGYGIERRILVLMQDFDVAAA